MVTRFCVVCGTEVDESAAFCPSCGNPLEGPPLDAIPPAPAWPDPEPEPASEREAEPEPDPTRESFALDRQHDPVDSSCEANRRENRQDAGLELRAWASPPEGRGQQRGRTEVCRGDDEQRHRVEPQSLVGS